MLVATVGFFAVLPAAGKVFGMFLGAFAGSWIYGVFFSYLEGRRSTELLSSSVNAAIIFGGGLARAVGSAVLTMLPEGREAWMPLVAAGFCAPISAVAIYILSIAPDPSTRDVAQRNERKPMTAEHRSK